jgi:hypothetical protein
MYDGSTFSMICEKVGKAINNKRRVVESVFDMIFI